MPRLNLEPQSGPFLRYLEQWLAQLPVVSLKEIAPDPARAAIVSVDVINGFCVSGPLASERVGRIVEPIASLFQRAWDYGIRHIILIQDSHEPDAVEFAAWPPHCVRGTAEAEPVDAFKRLPFFPQMVILEKNSLSSGLNTGLNDWLAQHPEVNTFIVVGDVTDLCTYQLAMHLRLDANARQLQRRVIVPTDGVETYDRPIEVAEKEGGFPHPGDLMHAIFLYHMALNGIEVVEKIT
ncbi:isochorismatase family cysteine hydrolase [uncultured Thermanaerothrix sp.]|uniref:cysteine hydrolase family protein n=1 Tax=uncultured Thermanaerothrix sp. TaxID=1195149 RepID=UPI00263411A7|nr:isochorismatase family cysteine hydrolase [uncultured Thermanaerothrix sp.]